MQSPSSCYHSLWVETWYSVPAFPQLFLVLSIPLQTPMKIISQWILHIWHFFNPEWLHTLRDNWGLSLAPLPRKTSFSNSLVSTSLWKKKIQYQSSSDLWCQSYCLIPSLFEVRFQLYSLFSSNLLLFTEMCSKESLHCSDLVGKLLDGSHKASMG